MLVGVVKLEPIKGAINQAADILTDRPDRALSQGFVRNFLTLTRNYM